MNDSLVAATKRDLVRSTARGGVWTVICQAAVVSLALATTAITARLLLPADFGIIEMASTVVGFASLFSDAGLSSATVQRRELTDTQIAWLFWVSILVCLAAAAIVFLSAPVVAWFFGEDDVATATRISSVGIVLAGIRSQPIALLRRHFQFGTLAILTVSQTLISSMTIVLLAWWTRSFTSLAIGPVVGGVAMAAASLWFCGWRVVLPRRDSDAKSLLKFGSNVLGANLLNFFSRNGDNVLIGAILGARPLGIYSKAYQLMMFPLNGLNAPVGAVALPLLSRLVNDPGAYRHAYRKMVDRLVFVTTPICVVGLMVGSDIIRLVLGREWTAAGPVFQVLAINCLFQPIYNSTGWLFLSQDRTGELLRWGMFASTVTVVSFAVGIGYGILGVAVAYTLAMVFLGPFLFHWIGRQGPASARVLYGALAGVLVQAVFCIACLVLVDWAFQFVNPAGRVVACAISSALGSALYLFAFGRADEVLQDIRTIVTSLAPSKP